MIKACYVLFTILYTAGAKIFSLFNAKAKQWVEGRKNTFQFLQCHFDKNIAPVIWFHCASLGEFEQGRPVMERLRQLYPKHELLVTFFSPSGYEIRKDYKGADVITYLPMDSRKNAKAFLSIVKPALVVLIKYEFWYFYLNEIGARQIPLLLVSGLFRNNQIFFTWYGSLHREMLRSFTHIFVQNNESVQLLSSLHINNVSSSGDTRFDRVLQTAGTEFFLPLVEQFCAGRQTLVAGSTWTEDDEELDHFVIHHPEMRFVIAPHDISEERLRECEQLYKHTIRYSQLADTEITNDTNTLIIDNIGMLSRIYKYANIAYVGGAFGGDGIHNILEPAVFGKPVLFGPEYDNFPETFDLIEAGGAFSVENALELETVLNKLLSDDHFYTTACASSAGFVKANAGATQQVIDYIQEKRLLTN